MIELHYHPGNASMVPHVLLNEIGAAFVLRRVDRDKAEHKSPEYLALNPNGLIPVLTDGELVLYETAAICLHLADTHPQVALAPPPGTAERAQFYKWLAWHSNTVQPMLTHYFYPERIVDAGNADGAAQVRRHAEAKVVAMLEQIDAHLRRQRGPWFFGERYSAVDAYCFVMCRWTRSFASRPARSFAHTGAYLQRMLGRPAVQRVLAAEGLAEPFV
jgi:glutathione S-transferase